MSRTEQWVEQAVRVVDASGDSAARIRLLSSDGECWQTWERPFAPPVELAAEVEAMLVELTDELPAGENALRIVAESTSGQIRTQLARRVNGRRKRDQPAFGNANTALQAMYDAQATTMRRTLDTANVQLEVLMRTVETTSRAHAEAMDVIRRHREADALAAGEQAPVISPEVQQHFGELLKSAPLMLEMWLQNRSPGGTRSKVEGFAADVAAAAVKGLVAEKGEQ